MNDSFDRHGWMTFGNLFGRHDYGSLFSTHIRIRPLVIVCGSSNHPASGTVERGDIVGAAFVSQGALVVQSGGAVDYALIGKGGNLALTNGAKGGILDIETGGSVILNGASVQSVQIDGGTLDVTSASLPLHGFSNGQVTLHAGVSANHLLVGPGGTLVVDGGKLSGTVISGRQAQEQVLATPSGSGPADENFRIGGGGVQTIHSGATVASGIIGQGGSQTLLYGATAFSVTVASGGNQTVMAGATADDDVIAAGGSVQNGGVLAFHGSSEVKGQILGNGLVNATGQETGLRFDSGSLEHFSGTVAVAQGGLTVENGAEAANVTFQFASGISETLTFLSGAPATLRVTGFDSDDRIVFGGLDNKAQLVTGASGQILIETGGTIRETLYFGADGSPSHLTLTHDSQTGGMVLTEASPPSPDDGARLLSNGVSSTSVGSGEIALIVSGATVTDTQVQAGGELRIDGVGLAGQVNDGTDVIRAGGTASGTVVYGGHEHVLASGTAIGSVISAGTQDVEGGTTRDTLVIGESVQGVDDGLYTSAVQTVASGGQAIGTNVEVGSGQTYLGLPEFYDAFQYVQDGGTATDTELTGAHEAGLFHTTPLWNDGQAHQIVSSGGSALRTTIHIGGVQDVQTGGLAADTVLDGGQLILEDGARYDGTLTFAPLTPSSQISSLGTFPTGSTLTATMTQLSHMTISGFDGIGSVYVVPSGTGTQLSGDTINRIVISDLTFDGATGEIDRAMIAQDGTLSVTEGDVQTVLHFSGVFGSDFYFQRAPDGGTEISYGVPCYCPGTLIMTPEGERAVESLTIGDLVVTASGAARPVRWIGRRSYDGRFARGNPDIMPIEIGAGALGHGLPRRPLRISPLHAMALDGHLIPGRLLVNNSSIRQLQRLKRVDYMHIELETHDLILAEGAASETFVDDGSRSMFTNAAEFHELYPAATPAPETSSLFCLPRLEEGPLLAALRERLGRHGDIVGFVDVVNEWCVEGWARSDMMPDCPLELIVRQNGREIGRVHAGRFRADLTENGTRSGRFAFSFPAPFALRPADITVEDASTGTKLARSGTDLSQAA